MGLRRQHFSRGQLGRMSVVRATSSDVAMGLYSRRRHSIASVSRRCSRQYPLEERKMPSPRLPDFDQVVSETAALR